MTQVVPGPWHLNGRLIGKVAEETAKVFREWGMGDQFIAALNVIYCSAFFHYQTNLECIALLLFTVVIKTIQISKFYFYRMLVSKIISSTMNLAYLR